jgi:hypothetical protein
MHTDHIRRKPGTTASQNYCQSELLPVRTTASFSSRLQALPLSFRLSAGLKDFWLVDYRPKCAR